MKIVNWARTGLAAFASVVISLIVVTVTYAHHNTSVKYDQATSAILEGAVARIEWRNPHVYLYLTEDESNAESVLWEVEGPPPAALRRAGWSRDDISLGDRIVVTGHPARDAGSNAFLMEFLTTSDDDRIGMDIGMAAIADEDSKNTSRASSLAGIWGTTFDLEANLLLVEASKLDLTEKGRLAVQSFDEQTDSPALDCIPETAPKAMLYPDIKSIELGDSTITIRSEAERLVRTVHLDQTSHDGIEPSLNGHSIGRWDGDTLVVETTHFSPHRQGNATGLPSGLQKHLLEEFELISDGSRIRYYFELEDPEYFEGQISAEIEFAYRPDLDYEHLTCDIENARRYAQ